METKANKMMPLDEQKLLLSRFTTIALYNRESVILEDIETAAFLFYRELGENYFQSLCPCDVADVVYDLNKKITR